MNFTFLTQNLLASRRLVRIGSQSGNARIHASAISDLSS